MKMKHLISVLLFVVLVLVLMGCHHYCVPGQHCFWI